MPNWIGQPELKIKTSPFEDDYIRTNVVLGHGQTGNVVVCLKRESQERFALKELEDSERGMEEVELHWRASVCKNVVNIVDIYRNKSEEENLLLLVLEYMEGGSMYDILEKKGKLSEQETAEAMRDICPAIKFLHARNIAHRDIKLDNLLCTKKENGVLKLSDFSESKETPQNSFMKSMVYTPYYGAPEVLNGENYNKSCDIWSLGVTMYTLLSGVHPPYYKANGHSVHTKTLKKIQSGPTNFPESKWKHVSEDAKNLIRRMMKLNPRKRATIDDIVKSKWFSNWSPMQSKGLGTTTVSSDLLVHQERTREGDTSKSADHLARNREANEFLKIAGREKTTITEVNTKGSNTKWRDPSSEEEREAIQMASVQAKQMDKENTQKISLSGNQTMKKAFEYPNFDEKKEKMLAMYNTEAAKAKRIKLAFAGPGEIPKPPPEVARIQGRVKEIITPATNKHNYSPRSNVTPTRKKMAPKKKKMAPLMAKSWAMYRSMKKLRNN